MIHTEFHKWLTQYKGLSRKTAYLYTLRIDRFSKMFGNITAYSSLEVLEFVLNMEKSVSDHNGWVIALTRYQHFCEFNGQNVTFAEKLHTKSEPPKLPKPFTEEEIDSICSHVPLHSVVGKRDRAILELLYCGLRNNEVCTTTVNSLENETILVFGKGAKERYVPINDVAWNFLLDHVLIQYGTIEELESAGAHGLDFAFVGLKERLSGTSLPIFRTSIGNTIYPRAIRHIVSRYARLANVHNAHPHRFRHSFATHTLDAGLGNITALRDVMGHTKLDMTQRYVLTTKIGRERVKSFHPRQRRQAL